MTLENSDRSIDRRDAGEWPLALIFQSVGTAMASMNNRIDLGLLLLIYMVLYCWLDEKDSNGDLLSEYRM